MARGNPQPGSSTHPDDDAVIERFRPTSGRLMGALALVASATVCLIGVMEWQRGFPAWGIALALLGGALAWASMLRPALWATHETLVLRTMFSQVSVPLAAIEEMAVRQVMVLRAGEERLVSTVLGRSLRKVVRGNEPSRLQTRSSRTSDLPYVDWAEERLHALAQDARDRAGIRPGSDKQVALAAAVRREHALVPIALVAVSAAAFAISLIVALVS